MAVEPLRDTLNEGPSTTRQQSWWPLVAATLLLAAVVAALLVFSLKRTDGRLVYALDDPYIHMAMAKSLATSGVWGLTPDAFTSSSSSIAWTAALGFLFWILGIRETIPIVVNLLLAVATLVFVHRYLTRGPHAMPGAWVFATLAALVLATPLPTLAFAGQEHILHVLCTLAFLFMSADVIARASPAGRRDIAILAALAFALPLVRYEGLYPVAAAAALLFLRGRWWQAIAVAAAGAAPIGLYAFVSIAHHWWWAPNSVLLKGNVPDLRSASGIVHTLGYSGYTALLRIPAVAFLTYGAIVLFLLTVRRGFWRPVPVLLTMFVGIALLHLQYSQPLAFWLFRYEAYLVAAGITIGTMALLEVKRSIPVSTSSRATRALTAVAGAMLLFLSPLTERAVRAAAIVPDATANIHEQQYQMGLFLREHYAGSAVALNDIGAAAFLADIRVLDLVGLASMDVARLKRARLYSALEIAELADEHDVRLAIVYDHWFPKAIPRNWRRAGSWTIDNAVVVGGPTVTFYATRPEEYPALVEHLREFSGSLPPGVAARIGP